MKANTIGRILQENFRTRSPKAHYWAMRAFVDRVYALGGQSMTGFRRHVLHDQIAFFRHNNPIPGETQERARHAVDWLLRAQDASPDGGVSLGYFPCGTYGRAWQPSYPETTGYIIQSLLDYAQRYQDFVVGQRAVAMAEWETQVQMPSGAVQGGPVCAPEKQTPAVFNTGMVLHGWTSVLMNADHTDILRAAERAANFLIADQDENGHFRTHGTFVAPAQIKTYNVLCAWALYRFGTLTNHNPSLRAAIRNASATMDQQQENGWFAHNDLSQPTRPLTHTIGYTLQGLLEVGIAAGREEMITAAQQGVMPLLKRIAPDGFLHGRFFSDWEPASFSACLTGSAQIAIVCSRLFAITGNEKFKIAADQLLNGLKGRQKLETDDWAIKGALAGSFPMFLGSYMSAGYPNWATKYLLDALMLQDAQNSRSDNQKY